ncbi:hypothetical protein NE237_018378 [Protea cynaroides]|uniref:Uncharacterized protein n=1 Tax=Protea cynaroides TaxID=273540 RepID=A0A9Q0K9U0_9MAGN|nr:hypothetical protein NE237_018378 [Protea cynaroides]
MSTTLEQQSSLDFCERMGLKLRAFEFVVAGGHGGVVGSAIGIAGGSHRVFVIASVLLVLSFLLLHTVEADQLQGSAINSQSSVPKKSIDCGSACKARCQLSKRPKLCKRACGTCCLRCQCVPAGTSGNADSCPCYATMTTRNNKLKCP